MTNSVFVSSFLHYSFCLFLVPWGRLSWLLVSCRAHGTIVGTVSSFETLVNGIHSVKNRREHIDISINDGIQSLRRPEDEDEEKEKDEEHGDVVHRAQHDDELVAQRRHEPHQLQYPQQPERTQYRQTAGTALYQLHQATDRHTQLPTHSILLSLSTTLVVQIEQSVSCVCLSVSRQ